MQTRFPDPSSLYLAFDTLAEAESFFGAAQQQSGFLLQLDRELHPPKSFEVNATAPGFRFAFQAEAVQILPGAGTVFQLIDWDLQKAIELGKALKGEASSAGGAGDASKAKAPETANSSSGPQQGESLQNISPAARIRALDPRERFQLSMRAGFSERKILLRDPSPQILQGLLNNPRLETKEVLEIVRSPYCNSAILEQVSKNRKWMSHPEMAPAIARNPKTPQPQAIRLLDTLSTPDLQQMAKSSAIRETLRKAALRTYLKRTGQLKGRR